jgi:hypothetical protein
MEDTDRRGTSAVALRLLAALDDYLKEIEQGPPPDGEAECGAGNAFIALQAHAARLPFTSAAWLEVFISRAELAHARRSPPENAAETHVADCQQRHLAALHRMRLLCLEWQRDA